MERGKCRYIFASLAGGLWMLLIDGLSFAAEEAAPPAGAEPPKAEAPAAAPGAPVLRRLQPGAKTAAIFHGNESVIQRARRGPIRPARRRCLGDTGG